MSETPQQPPSQPTLTLDFNQVQTWLTQIAKYYTAFKWLLPMLGLEIPPQADILLTTIANEGKVTPESFEKLKQTIGEMKPAIGEPVLTRQLAEIAYRMHKEGMSLRDIAEEFTKQGNPCSHATIARWINMIEAEKKTSRVMLIIRIVKITAISIAIVLAFLIGVFFF
jgi:hypothetical protein